MCKKIFVLAVIAILFSGYAYAQVPRDGIWWNNLEMGQKKMYIQGVADGIHSGAIVLSLQKNVDKKGQATVEGA